MKNAQSANQTASQAKLARRHRSVALVAASAAAAMLVLAFASVPLYRLFCQATGFAGTPRATTQAANVVLDRTVVVRFDATVSPDLDWSVAPLEATKTVRLGETTLVYFRAANASNHAIVGTASFNVSPDQAGSFFNKLECFCFTEQYLDAGQSIDMPVRFFVDPEMVKDKDAGHIGLITLSYTFYPVDKPKLSAANGSRKGS